MKNVRKYYNYMRKTTTYGISLEILALSKVYQLNFHKFSTQNKMCTRKIHLNSNPTLYQNIITSKTYIFCLLVTQLMVISNYSHPVMKTLPSLVRTKRMDPSSETRIYSHHQNVPNVFCWSNLQPPRQRIVS